MAGPRDDRVDHGALRVAGVYARKIGVADHLLMLLEPRHMGIAEHRNTVWLEPRRLLRGSRHALHRLAGKTIHQIKID